MTYAPTDRTRLRRKRDRGSHDRETVHAILDEALIAHVAVNETAGPVVLPMAFVRIDESLYLHGAAGNRLLRTIADGAPVGITVTLIDGLVLARSAFHHSMNYRCVVVFGSGARVTEPDELVRVSDAFVERMSPGRSEEARRPTPDELRATLVVRVPLEEASAKVRTGGPSDDDEDMALPVWSGVVPLTLERGAPVADAT